MQSIQGEAGVPAFIEPLPTAEAPGGERHTLWFTEAGELERSGRLEEAAKLLHRIVAEDDHNAAALHLLGIVALRRGAPQRSLELIERAIALAPSEALFPRNICEVYRSLGRLDEAVAAGRRAVALAPADPHTHGNLAITHYDRLELDDAIACCERAIALDPSLPGPHFELAEAALLGGDFARGWQEYEWRFRLPGAPQPVPWSDRPHWDGTSLGDQALLLVADQGYGDTIQFARYIPWAAARCPHLMIACSAEMQPIVGQQCAHLPMFDRWEDCPHFSVYCPLSGLPRLHGTRLASIPPAVPYVRADPQRARAWGERLDDCLPNGYRRIGIAWAGRPMHQNDRNRSIALAALAPLAALRGVALVGLQKGPAQGQVGSYFGHAPLLNLGPELRDFADTAAVLDHLDLVVSVDTAVAHLAGAMGRPACVLLPYAPDWRWLLGRTDSPWYPTLRLFRQPTLGAWDAVIAEVAATLGAVAERGPFER